MVSTEKSKVKHWNELFVCFFDVVVGGKKKKKKKKSNKKETSIQKKKNFKTDLHITQNKKIKFGASEMSLKKYVKPYFEQASAIMHI